MEESGRIGEIEVEPTNDGGILVLLYEASDTDPAGMLGCDTVAFTLSIERAVMLMAQIEQSVLEAQARIEMLGRAAAK